MEPIYDDYLHVLKACENLEKMSNYRPFVEWMTCRTGESMDITRALSLAFLIGTAFLIRRLFRKRRGGAPASRKAEAFELLFFVHPLFLFPYFYPSQISTSITMVWAALSLWVLECDLPTPFVAIAGAGLAVFGNFIRLEAIFYWIILVGALYVFRGPARGAWRPLAVFPREQWIKFAAFLTAFEIFNLVIATGTIGGTKWAHPEGNAAGVAHMLVQSVDPNYPAGVHWPVQIYAQLLYLKNLIYPAGFSFFGPWNHWWSIYQSSGLQISLDVGGVLGVAALFALGLRSKPESKMRLFSLGLLVFLGTSLACSSARRADWFFVSREVFATALFIPFLIAGLAKMADSRERRLAQLLVVIYLIGSVSIVAAVKYSSLDAFLYDEEQKVGDTSPYLNYERMRRFLDQGNSAQALRSAHAAYRSIPPDSIQFSRSARAFWESSLAKSYEIAESLGEHATAIRAVEALMRSDSYLSTWTCLASHHYPPEQCLAGSRRAKFCANQDQIRSELQLCSPEEFGPMKQYCETPK